MRIKHNEPSITYTAIALVFKKNVQENPYWPCAIFTKVYLVFNTWFINKYTWNEMKKKLVKTDSTTDDLIRMY